MKGREDKPAKRSRGWTFLSNHAYVLICLAEDPRVRIREIADRVGITERGVLRILEDLEREGHLRRWREGRRNLYQLDLARPLRHPLERHRRAGDLVELVLPDRDTPVRAERG